MQKLELKNAFIDTLERERTLRGWTQWEMAEKLEMSVPGYRKMVSGMTESISLYTAYRASIILNIPIPVLYGSDEYKDQMLHKVYSAPVSTCRKVEYYLDFATKLRHVQNKHSGSGVYIDLITLTGYMEDGMIYDSFCAEKVEIPDDYGGRVTKAFLLTENDWLPAYSKGDILLIEEKSARSGDVAVMLNMSTRRIYIRKVIIKEQYELHPVNGRGKVITIEKQEKMDWFDLGRVVASMPDDYDNEE